MKYFGDIQDLRSRPLSRALLGTAGLTFVEVLIATVVMGLLLPVLANVLGGVLQADRDARIRQQMMAEAGNALARIQRYVHATDTFNTPAEGTTQELLIISERLLDSVNNQTLAYGGDGYLDADGDKDGLVNEGGSDSPEYVYFELDKSDAGNWKLTEKIPNYSTSSVADLRPAQVLCEHVRVFSVSRPTTATVVLELTLQADSVDLALTTRAWAPLVVAGSGTVP